MTHNVSNTPRADIPRSSFDRSHGYKSTFDIGDLIPFYCDEALPGDTFNLKVTAFARLATPIKPIMDNMFMETFFFSVPIRQVWENWEKFNGEQVNPDDSTDFVVPSMAVGNNLNAESIFDYMGIPVGSFGNDPGWQFNSLHLRAYNHIYNQWFRNENLIDSLPVDRSDGPDNILDYTIQKRAKRPDYFTSALPWPQKGDAVTVPLGDTAPVTGLGGLNDGTQIPTYGNPTGANSFNNLQDNDVRWGSGSGLPTGDLGWTFTALEADLSQATGVSINDLRQSFQVQKILERDARGGTRYPEILKAHFGVTDPQMLVLQRPEFLGGGSAPININPVEQTSKTDDTGQPADDSPQGNLAAFGTVTLRNHGFTKSFTEHCLIIGIVNVRADLTYQQGLNRMWSRQTRFDYYWPALSHIGEQSILNQEIKLENDGEDLEVFGYQERYAEYRYKPSLITGKFRSNFAQSLDVWHLSEEFANIPKLNQEFIEDNTPLDRCIAVPDEPHFLFDSYLQLTCARPMPLYGTPGLIDHF